MRRPVTLRPIFTPGDGTVPGPRGAAGLGWALAALAAAGTGALAARAPALAVGMLALLGAAIVVVTASRLVLVQLLLGALPWLLVLDAFVPPLVRTAATGIAAVALVAFALPLRYQRALGPIGAGVFAVVVLAHAVVATDVEQLKQAASYMIFPVVALAVLSERGRNELPRVRNAVFASGFAAMVVHLLVAASGVGAGDTKYGVGEKLGFAAEAPHEMALLSVVIAAAALTMSERVSVRAGLFTVAALPALLTGVRSAMLSVALILLVMLIESRADRRSVAVVGIALALAIAGGAGAVLTERLSETFRSGATAETASSSRTAIWGVALDLWADSGPPGWVLGAGLRSVPEAELFELGVPYIGHSDIIEVGVQIGGLGLLAWLLVWAALFRAGLRTMLLIPVVVYAVVNGAIGYVAPLTLALVLAAACRRDADRTPRLARDG
ncbi:MAG TPA: O-antigen ligase family protein [Thermoleophilaceae bacterium]|nr:O-antigen ligase family protein [Thermoleophilaceae bacterium]